MQLGPWLSFHLWDVSAFVQFQSDVGNNKLPHRKSDNYLFH